MTPSRPAGSGATRRGRRITIVVGSVMVAYALVVGAVVLFAPDGPSQREATAVIYAVGNLAPAGSAEGDALADMLAKRRIDALALLGDLAGPDGSAAAWQNAYRPLYGAFDPVARPTPGDIEYQTASGSGYFTYFAEHAGAFAAAPYYAFTLGGWRIYSLNSQVHEGDPGSEMYEWLRNDLATTTLPCVAAFWHDPVYSAGPSTTGDAEMSRIFDLLAASGADIVLSADEPNYQRWSPIQGVTSFVVGTGGADLSAPTRTDSRIAYRSAASTGVLQLELQDGRAGFEYLSVTGAVVDSGSVECHGRPTSELPRPAVPTALTAVPGPAGVQLNWTRAEGDPVPIGYLVYRGPDVIAFSEEPRYLDTDLAHGASVLYSVRSVAATGARSAPGNPAHSGGGVPGYTDDTWSVEDANPSAPTADKPQSKLWRNDGTWWGILYGTDPSRPARSSYFIQRFDPVTQAWINTGAEVDERNRSHADALWDEASQNLYVASTIHSGSIKLYRFSYADGSYVLDPGFPVRVSATGSETVTVAKDSTETLWMTMTQLPDGSGPCEADQACVVRVMHSTDAEYRWSQPVTLPTTSVVVDADDISAVTSYGSHAVGIAWSNQLDGAMFFATHLDGRADDEWSVQRLDLAPRGADDHINLKTDGQGRVYMIAKTSLNDPANASQQSPLMVLWVREPDGTWRESTVWTVRDDVTRAQIVVDEKAGRVYAVTAQPGTGGSIYLKWARTSDLVFPPGLGTVLLSSGQMNNPTTTKQTVAISDGILVLASDSGSHTYWHNVITPELAGSGG